MTQNILDPNCPKEATETKSFRTITVSIFLSAGILAVFIAHTLYLQVVAEDAFITFQFARHLAEGQGIVWNAGEAPVEGYTNFLWLIISALILKSGFDVSFFAQLIGILMGIGTMIFTFQYGRTLFNLPSGYALTPCLFLAVSGPFAAWAGSGMETSLFGMLLIAGCYYFVAWAMFDCDLSLIACFLILLIATLTRPEGFMIFILVAVLGTLFTRVGSQTTWKHYFTAVSIYFIPFIVYFFWRYSYFGFL